MITTSEGGISPYTPQATEAGLPNLEKADSTHARLPLVDTIDRDRVLDAVTSECKRTIVGIGENMPYAEKIHSSPLRRIVLTSFNSFLSTYSEGCQPNYSMLDNLVETCVSKIDTISIQEHLATAKTIVEEFPSDKIALVIPIPKHGISEDIDWNSPLSKHSYEFMAKLVKKYAEQENKQVSFITDMTQLRDFRRVVLVEDAIYSGRQMAANVTRIANQISRPLELSLYCVRSNEVGLNKVKRAALFNFFCLRLNLHEGKRTLSLASALADSPEKLNFFFTSKLIPSLHSNLSFKDRLKMATNFVRETTLTISDAKIPDSFSFLGLLASGMKAKYTNNYPEINSLNFD